MCDWKRNNKLAIRNFHESCDLHDLIKLMLMRMLRRKHPKADICPIYSEYDPESPNQDYPDIWMRISHRADTDIYVWEIQENDSKEWENQIVKKHEDVNLIIVRLKEIKKKIGEKWNLEELRKVLEDYVV